MNILLLIIIVAAIIALIWGIGSGIQFLWIVAIVVGLIALIAFLLRVVRGGRS